MLKKTLCILLLTILVAGACKKKEEEQVKFTLSLTQLDNKIILNWNAVTISGFKNVSIYKSSSPIPDPTFDKPIDGNLLIAVISDKTVTSLTDSGLIFNSNGNVYYKLVLNLNNRFIVSNEASASFNGFSAILNTNNSSNNIIAVKIPEANLLFFINVNGVIQAVDYSQKKIIASTSVSFVSSNVPPLAVMNAGKPELYVYSSNSIVCLDGLTLAVKFTISVNNFYDYKVKNNCVYLLTSTPSIKTYNTTTHAFIGELFFNYPNTGWSVFNQGLLASGTAYNSIYVKYAQEYYNGQYVYKNRLLKFNLVGYLPVDTASMYISKLTLDSSNSYNLNTNLIQLSPNGKYITCNSAGDVYDIGTSVIHSVQTTNNFNPTVSYSSDGNYLLGSTLNSGFVSGTMDIFSLPGFSKIATTGTLNSGGSIILEEDFMDNDTLVSYNVQQTFQTQVITELTVLFKKIH